MNLRDLKYLVAVAKHRHFGRAAEACFVSQPTLSTQLKKLEGRLGVTLIERAGKRVLLTPPGAAIVAEAEQALRHVDALVQIAAQHRHPLGGELRLGVIPTVAPYLLPKILPAVRSAFDELSLKLTEGQTATLLALLDGGDIDAAVLALPSGDIDAAVLALPSGATGVCERALYREPFLLAVGAAHPLAGRRGAILADLEAEAVLLLEDGHCLRDQALDVCKTHGAVENTNFRATSIETLREMVAANIGVTLMPLLAVKRDDGVRYAPFRDADPPQRQVGLIWRASSPRQALMEALAERLVNVMETHLRG